MFTSDKILPEGSWRPACAGSTPGTLAANCEGQRLGERGGRPLGEGRVVRKTMGLKAGGSGKRFFSSVFLMAFSKSAGTSSAGACCALSGWGGLVGGGREGWVGAARQPLGRKTLSSSTVSLLITWDLHS